MTEGMSIRAISRVTDIHKTTILSLLLTVGLKCARLFDANNVRKRDAASAYDSIGGLSRRIAEQHRTQLTTDGHEGYIGAVEERFGANVDFAQLVK